MARYYSEGRVRVGSGHARLASDCLVCFPCSSPKSGSLPVQSPRQPSPSVASKVSYQQKILLCDCYVLYTEVVEGIGYGSIPFLPLLSSSLPFLPRPPTQAERPKVKQKETAAARWAKQKVGSILGFREATDTPSFPPSLPPHTHTYSTI